MLKKLLRASTKAICRCQHVHNFLLLISHLITTNSTSCTVRFFRFFEELGYHIALGVDLVGFSRHSSVMVLLSLLSEVPALRFFVVVVLTTCAYIVHRQSASKPVKNFPHKTAVHEVPAESPVFEAQEASHPPKPPDTPVSANYFPSREFNYKCGFCFHTETSSYILTHDKARRGLKLLKEAGMRKLNIASGEPFLHPKFLSSRFATAKRIWVSKHQYRQ